MSNEVFNLIERSNDLSLDDFCKKALTYLKKPKKSTIMLIEDVEEYSDNKNLKVLLNQFLELEKKGLLAELNGFVNLESIADSEEHEHRDYIAHLADEGMVDAFDCETFDEKLVSVDSVQIISCFQESEMIVNSPELGESYYILYHDGGIETLLANSNDNFIKSLYILSLMNLNEEIFRKTLTLLDSIRNEEMDNVLRCVNNFVFSADSVLHHVNGVNDPDDLNEFYWKKRG